MVPADQLEVEVRELAGTIAHNEPLSIRASQETMDQISGDPAHADPAHFETLYRACFDSSDYAEGRAAFMAKRPPAFTGR